MARYNDHLTYEAVMDMNYLEMIINEALRKYPPVVSLTRGVRVLIPVYGIHHDPDYYPEPEKFDPDRFSSENKRTRPAFSFLPFGDGPRVCIGARFGMMQAKLGLISILLNYKFSVNVKTQEPLQYHTQSFTLSTKGGMWLNFEKITEEKTVICNGEVK
ncbi:hypothetical protein WA026_009042 [Henosepilachna vigintioctopunctata]|uniref:Cytochrome P450 n=1 Tax=Henosepilachna vigintioctopunctata TaxID=420089 RepID=A0AAW1UQJ0_9CUCU